MTQGGDERKWWGREVVRKGSGEEGKWWWRGVVTKGGGDDGMCWGREVVTKGSGDEGEWWWREVGTMGSGDVVLEAVCVVLCVSWLSACRSHWNGCMNVAWTLLCGGSRSTKPCVFPCKVAAGDDERYLLCAAVAAAVVSCANRFLLCVLQEVVVPVCVILCVSCISGCGSHCNGCRNVAWAMLWGGSRSTKPCVFPCKMAAGDDERYLLCAAVAAAVVSCANRFLLCVLQEVVVPAWVILCVSCISGCEVQGDGDRWSVQKGLPFVLHLLWASLYDGP